MDFSVIVCTYNRANNLPRCLGALARQKGTEGIAWEVVVVDNNSTDDTPAMVVRLARELPITIRLFLPWVGCLLARGTLSRALPVPTHYGSTYTSNVSSILPE